eukprot:5000260-Prymnesium_polylepis.1
MTVRVDRADGCVWLRVVTVGPPTSEWVGAVQQWRLAWSAGAVPRTYDGETAVRSGGGGGGGLLRRRAAPVGVAAMAHVRHCARGAARSRAGHAAYTVFSQNVRGQSHGLRGPH